MFTKRICISLALNRANDYALFKKPVVQLNGGLPQNLQCATHQLLESLRQSGFATQEEIGRASADIQHNGSTVIESGEPSVDVENLISECCREEYVGA